jgi:hypothetical protein
MTISLYSLTALMSDGPHCNLGVGCAFPHHETMSYILIYRKPNLQHNQVRTLRARYGMGYAAHTADGGSNKGKASDPRVDKPRTCLIPVTIFHVIDIS